MIINKELGLNFCENPWQGSFIVDELTDLVEEQVYQEFERISERGGVLGAMDTMYQRGKIQEESLYYESKKHDGSLPIVGVNTFLPPDGHGEVGAIELMRSSTEEKDQQVANVEAFREMHAEEAGPRLNEAAAGGAGAEEYVRGVDGGGQGVLARLDVTRAVRRGRRVPAEHVGAALAANGYFAAFSLSGLTHAVSAHGDC